ncbi:hypothetical protein H4W32_003432 [Actinophytocola algeriensis]|uniref:Uncharacterized protein n=1 Tax=Actinophytocola algeriensis TaxID=1768010 RepID=A0A7W7Q9C4_9PSEU|nr:hypothetical protein [Actinophytocola algeriensis]MBE1475390.1 hypothetical protein [Actinophytocola algeriensis]
MPRKDALKTAAMPQSPVGTSGAMKDPFVTRGVMKDPFVVLTVMKGPFVTSGVMKGPFVVLTVMKGPFMTSGRVLKAPFMARRPTVHGRKPATKGLPAIPSTWRSPITPDQGGTNNPNRHQNSEPPP